MAGGLELTQPTLDKASLIRSITRESLEEFVREFWDTIIAEEMRWGWHMTEMCDQLQEIAERVFKGEPKTHDLLCNISPGTTKSTIFSIMYPAWVWTNMASARFICVSNNDRLAMTFSRKMRSIVESDKYRASFPEIKLVKDQNTKGMFANSEKGSRMSIGTGGNPIGEHAHFLIVDDPIDPDTASAITGIEMEAVNQYLRETLPQRKVDTEISVTLMVMQRLKEDDPAGQMLEIGRAKDKEDKAKGIDNPACVRHLCIPATLEYDVIPKRLEKFYTDGFMNPAKLGARVLAHKLIEVGGEYAFAGQFGQSPVPRKGGQFKVDRFHYDSPPRHWKNRIRYWDKASTKDGGDYTAGPLLGEDMHGRFWVLHVKRGQWDTHERDQIIVSTAQSDGVEVKIGLEEEGGSSGKDASLATIKKLAGFSVFADRPTGDKATRAVPYSDQVNGGNVYLAPEEPGDEWHKAYVGELRLFPRGKNDDQVDGSSGGFKDLTKHKVEGGTW